jgi:hypothetical protein
VGCIAAVLVVAVGAAAADRVLRSGRGQGTVITIRFVSSGGRTLRSWTLRCSPPAGSVPAPGHACWLLRSFPERYEDEEVQLADGGPPSPYLMVSGTIDGTHVTHAGRTSVWYDIVPSKVWELPGAQPSAG